jgi:hypothetical protein
VLSLIYPEKHSWSIDIFTILVIWGAIIKKAQVTPLYNKNDPILKTNYRPVSVLSIFSKIFEKILEQQLSDFFENIFNPYL